VRLRFLKPWTPWGRPTVAPGDVSEVADSVAKALLADGIAVRTETVLETAAVGPSEVAAHTQRPEPRARRG
jgi:hypothetical protein